MRVSQGPGPGLDLINPPGIPRGSSYSISPTVQTRGLIIMGDVPKAMQLVCEGGRAERLGCEAPELTFSNPAQPTMCCSQRTCKSWFPKATRQSRCEPSGCTVVPQAGSGLPFLPKTCWGDCDEKPSPALLLCQEQPLPAQKPQRSAANTNASQAGNSCCQP